MGLDFWSQSSVSGYPGVPALYQVIHQPTEGVCIVILKQKSLCSCLIMYCTLNFYVYFYIWHLCLIFHNTITLKKIVDKIIVKLGVI